MNASEFVKDNSRMKLCESINDFLGKIKLSEALNGLLDQTASEKNINPAKMAQKAYESFVRFYNLCQQEVSYLHEDEVTKASADFASLIGVTPTDATTVLPKQPVRRRRNRGNGRKRGKGGKRDGKKAD